jgi:hypothetical protein
MAMSADPLNRDMRLSKVCFSYCRGCHGDRYRDSFCDVGMCLFYSRGAFPTSDQERLPE